jgi:ABC-type polysaccharide/polyol phosphate transport system ATPase subunit
VSAPIPGAIRLRNVSRRFRILHERNATLKETILRRRRSNFTELWALRDVDLDIEPGEAVGVIGANGSGKSTLLKLVAGILPPQGGTVEVGGTVASMLELGAGFHPDFTARENIYMNAAIYGLSEKTVDERFDSIVAFSELEDFIDMPVKTFSSGMHMRLAFAVAAHVQPDVLLLDEVLAVGDEAFQRKCMARIFDYLRGGGTLLFVSHDATAVEQVCSRVIELEGGLITADGRPADVLPHYRRSLANADAARSGQPTEDASDTDTGGDPREGWGSFRATIVGRRLVGPRGETDRFVSGEPLTVEFDVDVHERLARPGFGVSIYTGGDVLLYGTHTKMDEVETGDLPPGPTTVRFTIPALVLHDGLFSMTLAVSSDGEACHYIEHALTFSVFQRVTGIGPVDLSGTWTIMPDGTATSGQAPAAREA